MSTLDTKISFFAGYIFTVATSISFVGIASAALVGLVGGFFGLLGKELYYAVKNKIRSAAFRVWMIGYWDKFVSKWIEVKNKF